MTRPPGRGRRPSDAILVAALSATVVLAGCASGASSQGPSPSGVASAEPSGAGASQEGSTAPSAPPSSAPSGAASDEPTADLGPFGCDFPVDGVGSTAARAQLTDVRVGEHDGYDRVVFEFANGLPEFHISEAQPPFTQDASGLPLEVDGSYFWQVRLNNASRVSPDGAVTYDGPLEFSPDFGKLVNLIEGGDFEAVSTWYVGMSAESCVRVLLLSEQPRLVIDIEH